MFAFPPLLSLLLILPRVLSVLSVNVTATCATLEIKLPALSVFYSGECSASFTLYDSGTTVLV